MSGHDAPFELPPIYERVQPTMQIEFKENEHSFSMRVTADGVCVKPRPGRLDGGRTRLLVSGS